MDSKCSDYILENKLHLWMEHDVDKELLDKAPYILNNERHEMADQLAETIYQRLDRYDKISDTVNTNNPDDIYPVERHEVNMYVFSLKELEELLKL